MADASVPRLELREWAERFGLVAGVTARGHGFSLGLWSAESVGQVMTRWRAFRAALQGSFPAAVLSHQVHGTEVRWHDTPADEPQVVYSVFQGLRVTYMAGLSAELQTPNSGVVVRAIRLSPA